MSDKNKAVLEQANAAVVRGDHEAFLAHCTDDVVWTFVGDKTLKGKEAVRQVLEVDVHRAATFSGRSPDRRR